MICQITGQCISCGSCLMECPKNAITVSDGLLYEINPDICNLCIGFSSIPKCKEVCPIEDAIILAPSFSKEADDFYQSDIG